MTITVKVRSRHREVSFFNFSARPDKYIINDEQLPFIILRYLLKYNKVIIVIRYNFIINKHTMEGDIKMNGVVKMENQQGNPKDNRYSRKIGRMGNSLGVSLPKRLAEKLNVVQGDQVEFVENDKGEILFKKAHQIKMPENVRMEVLEAFYDIFEEDKGILNDLRDR